MNHCLKLYEKDSQVASISAYNISYCRFTREFFDIKGAIGAGLLGKELGDCLKQMAKNILNELEKKNLKKNLILIIAMTIQNA